MMAPLSKFMPSVVIFLILFCSLAEECTVGKCEKHETRHYAGEIVGSDEFRSQVMVFNKDPSDFAYTFCSGVMISTRWVLTSAQCVRGSEGWVGGAAKYKKDLRKYHVSRFIKHKGYKLNGRIATNDIGLVQLRDTYMLHLLTQSGIPACCQKPVPDPNDEYLMVLLHSDTEKDSYQKYSAHIEPCPVDYSDPNVFCARYRGRRAPCQEDFGGPLYKNGDVYGIISFVDNIDQDPELEPNDLCDEEGTWFVLMSTSMYRDWIYKTIGK